MAPLRRRSCRRRSPPAASSRRRAAAFSLATRSAIESRADGAFAGERRDRFRADVEDDAFVAAAHEPARDVGAHPSEPDDAYLHGGLSQWRRMSKRTPPQKPLRRSTTAHLSFLMTSAETPIVKSLCETLGSTFCHNENEGIPTLKSFKLPIDNLPGPNLGKPNPNADLVRVLPRRNNNGRRTDGCHRFGGSGPTRTPRPSRSSCLLAPLLHQRFQFAVRAFGQHDPRRHQQVAVAVRFDGRPLPFSRASGRSKSSAGSSPEPCRRASAPGFSRRAPPRRG